MSSDSKLVEEILKALMTPNNDERKKAESALMNLMNTNKIGLVLCLTQILVGGQSDKSVLTYAAVIARKLIQIKEDEEEEANPIWVSAPPELKEQIKDNLIKSLISCTDKALKKKICNIVGNLYESVVGCKENWETVLKFIAEGFQLSLTPENANNIESAVFLLAKVYRLSYERLSEGIDVYIKGFTTYFKEGSLDLQSNSVEAICEILSDNSDKDITKKFKDLMIFILQTILKLFEQNEIDSLKLCLFALSDLAQNKPSLLKKSFSDIFILMGKIIEKKELDEDSVRGVAYEVIISLIEKHPKLITEDGDKLSLLINSIYRYGMEIEEVIDEDWTTPKSLSLTDEEYIPEEKLDEAISLIERLIINCKKETVLPIVQKIVMELLQHQEDSWKYKYIAYISVGKIAEFVDEIKEIERIIPIILNDIKSENPKVRYGCLFCISQFSSNLHDEFTELYAEKVIPSLCQLVVNDSVLRCKLQGYDSLECFVEESSDEVMNKYTESMLEALFFNFNKPDTECPQNLRETIVDCLGEIVSKSKTNFKKYSEKTFTLLANYLSNSTTKNDSQNNLFGLVIELLTKVGKDCPDLLKRSSKDIALALINLQNNIQNFKGEFGDCFTSSWETILPIIQKDYADIIPNTIESIIKVILKPPEMSISSTPEKTINIQEFLGEINTGKEKVSLEKKKITIQTSETEEYCVFIDLLNIILTSLKEYSMSFIEQVEAQAKKILTYPNNEIRSKASSIFPKIIDIVAVSQDQNKISQIIRNYLGLLVPACENESENEVAYWMLISIEDCIKDHQKALTQNEVNELFVKLFGIFDKVEKNRINLNKEETVKEKDIDAKKSKPKDEDIDDDYSDEVALENIKDNIEGAEDIINAFSDVIGTLFKTHKDYCMEIARKMTFDVLPKYFDENSSRFEKKMGLFILDDMVEFLGQEFLGQIWPDIAKILIKYTDHQASEIRQAASYGLGEFIKHTNNDYAKYSKDILVILDKALQVTMKEQTEEEYKNAQDNVVTAFGKLIKFRGNEYSNLKEIITKWLTHLPIVADISESAGQHELLCDIVIEKNELILGENNSNFPKIVQVLAKVYDTKYSNDEINKKILTIFNGIKQNQTLMALVPEAKKGASNKVKSKIEEYLC